MDPGLKMHKTAFSAGMGRISVIPYAVRYKLEINILPRQRPMSTRRRRLRKANFVRVGYVHP